MGQANGCDSGLPKSDGSGDFNALNPGQHSMGLAGQASGCDGGSAFPFLKHYNAQDLCQHSMGLVGQASDCDGGLPKSDGSGDFNAHNLCPHSMGLVDPSLQALISQVHELAEQARKCGLIADIPRSLARGHDDRL